MGTQAMTTSTSSLDRAATKSTGAYQYRERMKHHQQHQQHQQHQHHTHDLPDPSAQATCRVFPPAQCPSITLRLASPAERIRHSYISAPAWKGPLPSADAFVRREVLLHNTALTRDGGISGWVLVDKDGRVLMGGESIRKRGLFRRAGRAEPEDVVVHSVGAVYCPEEHRGRGYARRFMDELASQLEGWQRKDGRDVVSVLYSEIGRDFYARHGWHAHPSNHIRLPVEGPINDGGEKGEEKILRHDAGLKWPDQTYPVFGKDIAALAARDEALLRQRLTRNPDVNTTTTTPHAFALVPDAETFEWFRAREEFVHGELQGHHGAAPSVRGAVVRDPRTGGALAWCLWTCMWLEPDADTRGRNTLYLLRLVVDDDEFDSAGGAAAGGFGGDGDDDGSREAAVAALFGAAREYASRWGMGGVEAWNPDERTLRAARRAVSGGGGGEIGVEVVERTVDSIACLKIYGGGGVAVEWIANEKFGWC